VLADGAQLADKFSRYAGAFKSLPLVSEIPVRVLPAADNPPYPAQLSAALPHLAQLKPGAWLSARCDPGDPARVVPAQDPDEPLSTWTVHPVQEADLHQLAEVIRSAFEEQRGLLDPPAGAFQETAASLLARLENSRGWLAELEGIRVACIFYRPEAEHAHLSRLAVLPEYRRMGIGRCLLAHAEELAARDGFTRVRLGVRAEISANREYYQRLGYRVIEEHSHEGYTKITVYILEKEI
jgi:ribosomal protein S18 acetylase RimI-like enzyme